MKKMTLSLTEKTAEWLHGEAERRGLTVSDLIRCMADDALADEAKPVVRCDEKGVEVLTDNSARHRDVAYVLDFRLEIPNPDGEDEDDNTFILPLKATVAEATLGLGKLRRELIDTARRVNGWETLIELARHRRLRPDETIEVLTQRAGTAASS